VIALDRAGRLDQVACCLGIQQQPVPQPPPQTPAVAHARHRTDLDPPDQMSLDRGRRLLQPMRRVQGRDQVVIGQRPQSGTGTLGRVVAELFQHLPHETNYRTHVRQKRGPVDSRRRVR
jgi:hypothetical protein